MEKEKPEPTREQIRQSYAYANALGIIAGLTDTNTALLASCKELRDALAGAMRVLVAGECDQAFVDELERIGIANGIGVRADRVIALAEGR